MHILYVEESGTARVTARKPNRFFVIAGLIVPDSAWHGLSEDLHRLKIKTGVQGEFKWEYFSSRNRSPQNPLRALPAAKREEILTQVYQSICGAESVKAVACVARVPLAWQLSVVHEWKDIFHFTYKAVTERFQYYLQDTARLSLENEVGIVVAGRRKVYSSELLADAHERLLRKEPFTAQYRNLIEGILFQPCSSSAGVQLAGLVAGAIWTRFEHSDDRWYRLLEPAVRRSKEGVIEGYGIVEFPKAQANPRSLRS